MREINELMFEQLSDNDLFITANWSLADLDRRELLVANAGHCPLLLRRDPSEFNRIAPQGIPLGIQRDSLFECECCF